MAERKPEKPKASELLNATIETDTLHGACTKPKDLNKCRVTNVTHKGGTVFNRREK